MLPWSIDSGPGGLEVRLMVGNGERYSHGVSHGTSVGDVGQKRPESLVSSASVSMMLNCESESGGREAAIP